MSKAGYHRCAKILPQLNIDPRMRTRAMPPTAGSDAWASPDLQRRCHCANGGAVAVSNACRLLPQ